MCCRKKTKHNHSEHKLKHHNGQHVTTVHIKSGTRPDQRRDESRAGHTGYFVHDGLLHVSLDGLQHGGLEDEGINESQNHDIRPAKQFLSHIFKKKKKKVVIIIIISW